MELKEFIKNILSDVTNAIKESQDEINNGAIISPTTSISTGNAKTEDGNFKISEIEFEVAITVDSSNDNISGIGGGITVMSINIGGKSEKEEKTRNENVSKIKFSIPVIFPHIVVKERNRINQTYG
ncbi:MAG: trypco2 family protein [Muribaculaceae bacterium]